MRRRLVTWVSGAVLGAACWMTAAVAEPPAEPQPVAQVVVVTDLSVRNGAVATLRFTHAPSPPLPERSDGHFETSVGIVGFEEVGQ